MRRQDLIKRLNEQIISLKKEVNLWKRKYFMIEEAYQQLLNGNITNCNYFDNRKSEEEQITQLNYGLGQEKKNMQVTFEIDDYEQYFNQPEEQQEMPKQNTNKYSSQQQPKINRKLLRKATKIKTKISNNFRFLIEGCFILQKTGVQKHNTALKYAYPDDISTKCKDIFDVIYKYTFINDKIEQIRDDEFDSRKNQINFGTPYQDFQYIFDCSGLSDGKQSFQNKFQKNTHLMKKRYIYGLVRPEIINVNNKSYETEIAIGFISSFPFPSFFKDISLIVQQLIKLQLFNLAPSTINVQNSDKISSISKIIKNIVDKSQEKSMMIQDYPIQIELPTNVCTLKLALSDEKSYLEHHLNYIDGFIQKFSVLKLVKIIHYVLAQKHLIIKCQTRKKLNQILQIIQILIHPFVWVFPIIYHYSPYFSPFLNSPLPLIIGYVDEEEMGDAEDDIEDYLNQISKQIPQNSFVTIYAEDQDLEDYNQLQIFNDRIQKCFKEICKKIKQNKTKKQQGEENIWNNRLTDIFCFMISKLRKLAERGEIDEQVTPFHLQFMETQMVSYFKESISYN